METSIKYPHIQFTSRANPIRPFKVKTKQGLVRIYEPSEKEIFSKGFLEKVTNLFCRNFSEYTHDPGWLKYQNPAYKSEFEVLKNSFVYETGQLIKNDDGHLTLLVAKDEKGKLCGACLSYGLRDVPTAKETTMYIDSIAINEKYRENGIAKKMLKKVMNAEKNYFTDVFLVGEKMAENFYKKLGFKPLNPKTKNQDAVITWIMYDRFDYPKYVDFLTKPLQKLQKRWYDVAAQFIRNEY